MNYVMTRRAFAFIDGELKVQLFSDRRRCEDWVRMSLDKDRTAWLHMRRGYFLPGRIQFFTGEHYGVDPRITREDVEEAKAAYLRVYKEDAGNAIYNGVQEGALGEVWAPLTQWVPGLDTWRPR